MHREEMQIVNVWVNRAKAQNGDGLLRLSIFCSLIFSRMRQSCCLGKLQKRKRSLQCLLKDAEKRKFDGSSIKLWLSELKDVTYDADDIIDLYKIKGGELLADKNPKSKTSPVCCNFSSVFSCFDSVPLRHKIGNEIKRLRLGLETKKGEPQCSKTRRHNAVSRNPPSSIAFLANSLSSLALLLLSTASSSSPITLLTVASKADAFTTVRSSGLSPNTFEPTATPILSTSTMRRSLKNCSAKSGHVPIGNPAVIPSKLEFHPQCVMKPPTASWFSISSCGAHPLMIRPFPSILSSYPLGIHSSLMFRTTQTNGWPENSKRDRPDMPGLPPHDFLIVFDIVRLHLIKAVHHQPIALGTDLFHMLDHLKHVGHGGVYFTGIADLGSKHLNAIDDAFSHPSGRPAAAKGKGMKWRRMEELAEELKRSMVGWMRAEFPGVVRKVTTAPRAAKSLAMSTMGSMWPGDKNGKKRTLRLSTIDPIVCLLIRQTEDIKYVCSRLAFSKLK
ncbi:hypothetical protein M5K25_004480 [Dendrobium thyrsiflorum]|uniref:Disease resistance N-terminal domain-containing protein n=1 Tax=Dendrobium thyrsiflorum TaxID=117978 RepID=A0ABD0VLS6_DENTH